MTDSSHETTDVLGRAADADTGGLVAPANEPLPGSVDQNEFVVGDPGLLPGTDPSALPLADPGMLPAPDPATRVDGLDHPIEPQRWTLGEIAGLTGRFVAVFWAMSVVWLVVFSFLPLVVGWSPTVVTTGSMAPAIDAGTIVHVDHSVDPQILGPGSIITYDDPNVPDRKVTHRVIEVVTAGDGDAAAGPTAGVGRSAAESVEMGTTIGFRTKGDANGVADSAIVPVESVDGATRLVLPYAGLPQVWMNEGRWWLVVLLGLATMIAGVVALDTLSGYWSGRTMFRRRSVASAVAIAIAVMLGGPASNAVFASSADNSGSSFIAADGWWQLAVDADGPIAHWQFDDTPVGGPPITIVDESFETPITLNRIGNGRVSASTLQARTGSTSIRKRNHNDPNGGWAQLPATISGSFTFDVWVYRPSSYRGGDVDRLGLEDASFGGYTFYADHSSNRLRVDRRDGGNATGIGSTVSFDPPEDEWYRLQLIRAGDSLTVSAFDGGGAMLATTSAVDATYNSFDRWVIRGGHEYFVDDLLITQDPAPPTATDRIGTEDGVVTAGVTAQAGTLLTGLPGAPAAFDLNGAGGVLVGDNAQINLGDRAERTVELWFEPDATVGRQVLFEEGGTVNGINIYLDDGQLYGRAWGESLGWSNPLEVSTAAGAISANTTYHVAVVLDSVTDRSLGLYLDGALVGTSTKTDSALWHEHTDDAGIGIVNGATEYHDGHSSSSDGFDGTIDEVVLYNSALDATRIEIHHTSGR